MTTGRGKRYLAIHDEKKEDQDEKRKGSANVAIRKEKKSKKLATYSSSDSGNTAASACGYPHNDHALAMVTPSNFSSKRWLLDSAYSYNITPRKDLFIEGTIRRSSLEVKCVNDQYATASGVGDVRIKWTDPKGGKKTSILRTVYYIPEVCENLVSLGQFKESEGRFFDIDTTMDLKNKNGRLFLTAVHVKRLVKIEEEAKALISSGRYPSGFIKNERWQARLGHPGRSRLTHFEKITSGLGIGALKYTFCEICGIGKSHRRPSKTPVREMKHLLECIQNITLQSPGSVDVPESLSEAVKFQNFSAVISLFRPTTLTVNW
jgi:hypothetical protein